MLAPARSQELLRGLKISDRKREMEENFGDLLIRRPLA